MPDHPWLAWLIIFICFILTLIMILKPVIDYAIKKKDEKSEAEHIEAYKCRQKVNNEINQALENMRIYTHSELAIVVEYHNGGANLSGLPFQNLSCTYERKESDCKSLALKLNKLPVTLFPDLVQDLQSSDYIHAKSITQFEKKYPVLGAIIKNKKTKEILLFPLNGINSSLGFILLEKKQHEGFSKEDRAYISRLIQKISTLLDYKKSNKCIDIK